MRACQNLRKSIFFKSINPTADAVVRGADNTSNIEANVVAGGASGQCRCRCCVQNVVTTELEMTE